MVASYLDLPILDIYYIIDQKTYMFLLKALRHTKTATGLLISRTSYLLNNNVVMKEQYLTELENYCHQIPYLGFAPQEYLLICKIAYYAYKAHEDITDESNMLKNGYVRIGTVRILQTRFLIGFGMVCKPESTKFN